MTTSSFEVRGRLTINCCLPPASTTMLRRSASLAVSIMLALCPGTGQALRRIAWTKAPPASALVPHRRSIPPPKISRSTVKDIHSFADTKRSAPPALSAHEDISQTSGGGGGESVAERYIPPWSIPQLRTPSSNAYSRFRQHVNPLSRRYQMPADLPESWPRSDFDDLNLPLYLDVGCGKGGFLLELVGRRHGRNADSEDESGGCGAFEGINDDDYMNHTKTLFEDTTSDWLPPSMNYLGLEIRPGVSQYAQARVEKRGLGGILSFVGCNANVDLDRLLTLYQESAPDESGDRKNNNRLAFVSIQFPDPHFKNAHAKRRVVTPTLVTTLAKFMMEGDAVFLQSDIKNALEAMRERFVEDNGTRYFDEWSPEPRISGSTDDGQEEYGMENPLGIPTEREMSVLRKGLPVYRTLFKRNRVKYLYSN